MKKVMESSKKELKSNTTYTRVGVNIYKTGSKYRVRVGKKSGYTTSRKKAYELRTKFKNAE